MFYGKGSLTRNGWIYYWNKSFGFGCYFLALRCTLCCTILKLILYFAVYSKYNSTAWQMLKSNCNAADAAAVQSWDSIAICYTIW